MAAHSPRETQDVQFPHPSESRPFVIAVHGGAGHHAHDSEKLVRKALRTYEPRLKNLSAFGAALIISGLLSSACERSLGPLVQFSDAVWAISAAVSSLEDDPILNAGFGSSLTIRGAVECDSAIMSASDEAFGSVAAVSGVKNPIQVARSLLTDSRTESEHGLVAPLTLASGGATAYAAHNDIELVSPEALITPRATREWKSWMKKLENNANEQGLPPSRLDTVGAVALDSIGGIAAGVSSGGLLLKQPGRVGQAAIYGAGCWASGNVACSVSGEGERIIRAALARIICERIIENGTDDADRTILQVLQQRMPGAAQAGVIVLVKEQGDDDNYTPRLWCAFTTESMAVGWLTDKSERTYAKIIRRPENTTGVFLTSIHLDS